MRRIIPEFIPNNRTPVEKSWIRLVSHAGNNLQRTVSNSTDTTGVGNTAATLTTLFSYDVPPNLLAFSGEELLISAYGSFANTVSTDKEIRLTVGASSLSFTKTGYTNGKWELRGRVLYESATQLWLVGSLITSISGVEAINTWSLISEAPTAALTLSLKGTGTNASDVTANNLNVAWRGRAL